MNNQFTQPNKIVAVQTNKQAIARVFNIRASEVAYLDISTPLNGYKIVYEKSTQTSWDATNVVGTPISWTIANNLMTLLTSGGSFTLNQMYALNNKSVIPDTSILVTPLVSGGSTRTQHSKNQDTYSILDDITNDELTNDGTSALQRALAQPRTVLIPKGTVLKIGALPAGLKGQLVIEGELQIIANSTIPFMVNVTTGVINVLAGFTATFIGSFVAGIYKVFTGEGNVLGIRYVYPEWWGAVADNSTDCAAALNAASLCVQNSFGVVGQTRPLIELLSGQYRIKSTWTLRSSANTGLEVRGQGVIFGGTRLVADSAFTGTSAILLPGLTDTTQRIMDFKIGNFGIVPQTPGTGPTDGFSLGSAGNMIIGLKESMIYDLFISNFKNGLHVINTRLVKFDRIGIWNDALSVASNCLFIESQDKFCGDMTFHNCQFVNRQPIAGSKCILIDSSGTYVSSGDQAYHVAGIRFTECILYPAETTVMINSNNGARVDDIFFTTCQWDGDSNCMVMMVSGVGSQINDIQIVNNYMYGGNKTTDAQIQLLANGTGVFKNIRITGNTLGAGIGRAVNCTTSGSDSISGITVSDNHIIDFSNTTNPAIEFGGGCSRIACNNNIAMRTASGFFPYLIQIDTGCNYYVVTGNIGSGIVSSATVREVTAGANRVVANNL